MKLKINDRFRTRELTQFTNFSVNLKYDAIASAFAFAFYFDPDNIEHKELSCIGHYHLCTIEHNNETLLTGQILSEAFNSSSKSELVSISGYSLPGILEDCEISPSIDRLQFDLLGLQEISRQIITPFGIKQIVDPIVAQEMVQPFDESNSRVSQNIKSFLTELATQKNVIISHNQNGNLVYTRIPKNQQSIFHFQQGQLPATSFSLKFNGQGMHSHIRVVAQADIDDLNAGDSEVRNPYVINTVYRPRLIIQNSGTGEDTARAARSALAQELKNLELTIVTDRWTLNDKIIRPGQTISVTNPEIYLYNKTNFVIEEVELSGNNEKEIATLNCVLPEVYNGAYPVTYIFAGINLH